MLGFGVVAMGAAVGGALAGWWAGIYSKEKAIEEALPGGLKVIARAVMAGEPLDNTLIVYETVEGRYVLDLPNWVLEIIHVVAVRDALDWGPRFLKSINVSWGRLSEEDMADFTNFFVDYFEAIYRGHARATRFLVRVELEACVDNAGFPPILQGLLRREMEERGILNPKKKSAADDFLERYQS